MGPAGTGTHDDKSGSAQVVNQPLGREPRGEIPAAAAGLATLIKTQRAFELNSQSIQTADQALQTITNLRRG